MGNHLFPSWKFLAATGAALLLFLAVACGGGGGGGVATPPPPPTAVPPSFTLQPVDQNVPSGTSVTFVASASGTPAPTYQWERSSDGLTWTSISGATQATFTLIAQTPDNQGRFRAKASNSVGTATSNLAFLTVTSVTPTVPAFTQQPQSRTVAAGQSVTFTVAASGNPTPTFQWERSSDGLNWTAITGATNASYLLTAQAADNGAMFRVKAHNSAGSATSSSASLVIDNNAPISLSNGQVLSGEVVQGGRWRLYTLQVPTGATSLVVRVDLPTADPDLYVRLGSAPTLSQFDGKSAGISAESVQISQPGAGTWFIGVYGYDLLTPSTYTITASYGGGAGTIAPVITTHPTSRTVAPGTATTFSVAATGTPIPTYQWERSADGTSWAAINGATGADYTLTAQTGDNGAQFRATATNSAGVATSKSAILGVQTASGGSGTGNVTVTLYGTTVPAFIAVQDGSGPWQPLIVNGSTARFPVTAADGRYGIAIGRIDTLTGTPSYSVYLWQTTVQEQNNVEVDTGGLPANSPRVSGSLSGFQPGEVLATVQMRDGTTAVSPGSPSPDFSLTTTPGTQDLVAFSQDAYLIPKRIAVRRDLAITGDTALAPIDLNAEALPPDSMTVKADGTTGSSQLVMANGPWIYLGRAVVMGGAFSAPVLAPSQRSAQDLYFFSTGSPLAPGSSDGRTAYLFSDLSGTPSLTLGELLGPVSVGFVTGSSRLQAQWSAMNGATSYGMQGAQSLTPGSVSVSWSMRLSRGWLGASSSLTYSQPDLSSIPGVDARWQFSNASVVYWFFDGQVSYSSNPDLMRTITMSARDRGGHKAGDSNQMSTVSGSLGVAPVLIQGMDPGRAKNPPLPNAGMPPWDRFGLLPLTPPFGPVADF